MIDDLDGGISLSLSLSHRASSLLPPVTRSIKSTDSDRSSISISGRESLRLTKSLGPRLHTHRERLLSFPCHSHLWLSSRIRSLTVLAVPGQSLHTPPPLASPGSREQASRSLEGKRYCCFPGCRPLPVHPQREGGTRTLASASLVLLQPPTLSRSHTPDPPDAVMPSGPRLTCQPHLP